MNNNVVKIELAIRSRTELLARKARLSVRNNPEDLKSLEEYTHTYNLDDLDDDDSFELERLLAQMDQDELHK